MLQQNKETKKQVSFAFIVPTYNVESYLQKCIRSIETQLANSNYQYEIIIVDDGSTDSSGEIADKLSNQSEHVIVFHKPNGGLSDARNFGVKNTSADYLFFIDADDYINSDILPLLDTIVQNLNYDYFVTNLIYEKNGQIEIQNQYKNMQNPSLSDLFQNNTRINSAYRKIVKRTFLINNNLFFKENILSEDFEWTVRLYTKSQNCLIVDNHYYNYILQRPGSILSTPKVKFFTDMVDISRDSIEYIKSLNLSKNEEKLLLSYCSVNVLTAFRKLKKLSKNDQNTIIDYLLKNKNCIKYAQPVKCKIFNLASKIIGYKNAFRIMG